MSKESVQDPLKSLPEVFQVDEKNTFWDLTLEDTHDLLSDIILAEEVPIDVRQLFETAKNLSLYSWYAYRFHQVSELVGFSALEMALRERFEKECPNKRVPGLSGLLKKAKDERWIENARFPNLDAYAYRNAQDKKMMELMGSGKMEEGKSYPVEEPSKEEIDQAFAELDIVGGIVRAAPKLRNSLAHGSSTMHPGSIKTLRHTAEIINQLFT